MDARLPAHLEVSGLLRTVEAAGGFATVLAKGERDAGTILVVCCENGRDSRLFERMPHPDGDRRWMLVKEELAENKLEFSEYLERRRRQDPDTWIIELDIANGEQFIGFDIKKD
ncbi:hypothetical protein MB02_09255 [Croceicoccus estronivorus]|uniref:DUF1491 family protein n=1 Tax=Croceicoccus estronivorus TaxID=1172626 RepID=UPI000834A75E|nr:DUF1491 family protein [Croceicoccus estronivorus]OCC23987.1 hypothetical protein MB02_09255 [Croceicoccus estronivorus]